MDGYNKIEVELKRQAKRIGYTLRYLPESDSYHSILGPYYLVQRKTGRVKYQKLILNDVYQVVTAAIT